MGLHRLGGGGEPGKAEKGSEGVLNRKNRMSDPGSMSKSAAEWASVIHPKSEDRQSNVLEKNDKVPQAIEGTLAAVAASVIYSSSGMSRWGLAEATFGLYKLYCRHVREGVMDTIDGTLVTSVVELQELAHWIRWAKAAYEENTKACALVLEVEERCIIELLAKSSVGKPAYFIGINHEKRAIVLSIRGTFSATDVLTDLKPHSENFEDGYAHSGMLASARWIGDNVRDTLKDLMGRFGYRLVVTGHSLGAGTAALLTMILRETNEKGLTVVGSRPDLVTCWGFCCPPVVNKKMAERVPFVRCVVHQDDIVPRISPAALEGVRSEILQTHWTHAVEEGTKRKMMVDIAQTSATLLDHIEPALNYDKGELKKQVQQQGWSAFQGLANNIALSWAKVAEGNYGPTAKRAAALLNSGAEVAGTHMSATGKTVVDTMNEAIMQQLQLIEDDSRQTAALTASSMAASAQASNVREGRDLATSVREGRDLLEKNRLFVPGVLYHVIRRPLQPGEKLPDGLPIGEESSKGGEESSKGEEESSKGGEKATPCKHMVIRGDNPSSRFHRIVLSGTIVADHLCIGLEEGIASAMKWQQAGKFV